MRHPRETNAKIVAFLLALLLAPLAGADCDQEAAMEEFRAVAADSLASGVQTILNAIVDGLFAVVEPNESADSSSSSDSS